MRLSRLIRRLVAALWLSALSPAAAIAQSDPAAEPSATDTTKGTAKDTTKDTIEARDWPVQRICREIARVAGVHNLPVATFTRLIWTESRFDIFARERGLADPFDPAQALPASASLLADLRADLGTFGLAAAAYNAGPNRVRGWLEGRRGLPFETQDYLAALTGKQAEYFKTKGAEIVDFALLPDKSFQEGCEALPVRKTRARLARADGGEEGPPAPWGVQVAGNFSQDRAMRSWTRVRARLGVAVGDSKPRLYRQRTPRGMKSRWTVRLGTETRQEANALCDRIRAANGSCIVRRNR